MSDNAPAHASSNRPRVLYLSHAPEDIYDVVRRMAGEDIDLSCCAIMMRLLDVQQSQIAMRWWLPLIV